MTNVLKKFAVSLLCAIGTSGPITSYAEQPGVLQRMPDWQARLPMSPALQISPDDRALIIKVMEIMEARETSRKEMTVSWVPTIQRVRSGVPVTLGDFLVFQGSLMSAQQIRNDGHDTTPEENQKINDLRHRLYKEVAAITAGAPASVPLDITNNSIGDEGKK
jgi:hypothetical protein